MNRRSGLGAALLGALAMLGCGRVGFELGAGDGGTGPRVDAATDGAAGDAASGGGPVASGSYVGDGASGRSIPTGLAPALVLVKGEAATGTVGRTRTMPAGMSKQIGLNDPLVPGQVLSLGASDFIVGAGEEVNQAGVTYYWVAFAEAAGRMAVGSYVGDGAADRSVTGLGLDPDAVVTIPAQGHAVYARSAAMPAGAARSFQGGDFDGTIVALGADGFTVGAAGEVNAGGDAYHYVAWESSAGAIAAGAYTGDGTDGRRIGAPGFLPEHVLLLAPLNAAAHKSASTGVSSDVTLLVSPNALEPNNIQALLSDGFEVGTHRRVNEPGRAYYWIAFAP